MGYFILIESPYNHNNVMFLGQGSHLSIPQLLCQEVERLPQIPDYQHYSLISPCPGLIQHEEWTLFLKTGKMYKT